MRKAMLPLLMVAFIVMFIVGCTHNTAEEQYLFCSDNAFPPFEFWDSALNEYIGIDVDLIAALAKDQNFDYTIEYIGFDASCGSVQSGRADAIIDPVTITEERMEVYDFSEPFFYDGQVMCVSVASEINSLNELRGTVVAAKNGAMGTLFAEEHQEEYGYSIQYYDDSPTMYQAVVNGINSACFEDCSVAGNAINSGIKLKLVGDIFNPAPCAFAVKKGSNSELIELFNQGLKNLKETGELQAIFSKYGVTNIALP